MIPASWHPVKPHSAEFALIFFFSVGAMVCLHGGVLGHCCFCLASGLEVPSVWCSLGEYMSAHWVLTECSLSAAACAPACPNWTCEKAKVPKFQRFSVSDFTAWKGSVSDLVSDSNLCGEARCAGAWDGSRWYVISADGSSLLHHSPPAVCCTEVTANAPSNDWQGVRSC